MNAKERLRAYLEQRRELGESEMLLDALDVDDVMRMLGALSGAATGTAEQRVPSSVQQPTVVRPVAPEVRDAPAAAREVVTPDVRDDSSPSRVEQGDDWRQMMQQLQGSAPPKPPQAAVPSDPTPDNAIVPDRKVGQLRVEGVVFPLGLRVERPSQPMPAAAMGWQTLSQVAAAIASCSACGLAQSATRAVPGTGDPVADVMVVGEAPGEKEDLTGEPFVGPAGELLTKILGAIQLSRETVYICNVLKHRPPGNRNPMPDEVRACAPFLQRQIDLVQPKIILAFGTFAAQSLLGTKLAIGKLRQQLHWYQGIPLVATYHPAALLRNEAWKRPTWEDIKLARRILDATIRA